MARALGSGPRGPEFKSRHPDTPCRRIKLSRISLRIVGRVQGVGFRWFVMKEAGRLGVSGYVRNCADGAVEVAAEGTDAMLELLADACRKGPPASAVERVEKIPESLTNRSYSGFEIR